jgi:hypothetical protein
MLGKITTNRLVKVQIGIKLLCRNVTFKLLAG